MKNSVTHLRGFFGLTMCHRYAADLVVVYRFGRGHRRCKQCDRRARGAK